MMDVSDEDRNGIMDDGGEEDDEGRDNLLPEQIAQIRDFEDQVNSLVAELETRAADEGHATLGPDGHHHREAALTQQELSKLLGAVATVRESPGLAHCSTEALLPLMPHILAHVTEGSQTSLLKSASAALKEDPGLDLGDWLNDVEGQALIERVMLSADAGAVALIIMTAKDIDRRLMMQELIEETLQMVKHHISAHIIPIFDSAAATLLIGNLQQDDWDEGDGMDDYADEVSHGSKGRSKGKKKKSIGRASTGSSKGDADGERRLKPLLKQLIKVLPRIQEIVELFEVLTTRIRVDDRQLLTFSPLCLSTLAIDPSSHADISKLQPIQHCAMSLLQTIFGQYEQHRILIMEDVFTTLLKLPSHKRNLRTFRLHYRTSTLGSDSQNIQMATALILLLLQSVITKPVEQLRARGKAHSGEGSNHGRFEGEEGVVIAANRFAQLFLDKCSSKDVGSEFRPHLLNFIEDLLVCFLMPEWPAAEVLLQAFCILLLNDLLSPAKSSNIDGQYFLHSLDLLGKILSRLRELSHDQADLGPEEAEAYLVQVIGEELTNSVRTAIPEGTDVIAFFRDLFDRRIESSAISLTGKKKKRKKSSMGAKDVEEEGEGDDQQSKADSLTVSGPKRGRKSSVASMDTSMDASTVKDDEEEVVDVLSGPRKSAAGAGYTTTPQDLARQLVLNYLTKRSGEEEWVVNARYYHVARWVAEAAKSHPSSSGYWKYLDSAWNLPPRQSPVYDLNAYIPQPEGIIRLSLAMAVQRTLFASFDDLLFRLLALLGQEQATWRARVMKAFTGILEHDPMLMAHDRVKQAVIDRFQDEAISVRQAAVDLVGKYVLQKPALLDKYYQALMERLVDKGVSVRKTIVKIFRDFLIQNPNDKLRTEICRRLVKRASIIKEEDTLKDLIRDTFQEMWFSTTGSRDEEDSGGGSHARRSSSSGRFSEVSRLEAVALQMVEVIAGLQNTDWLVLLLKGLLFGPGEGEQEKKERAKQRKGVIKRCSALVDCLINLLVKLEEDVKLPVHDSVEELSTTAKQLLAVISTLFVFSRADPNFLLHHVDTLIPYLKAENQLEYAQEANVCYMVSNMVALVIPHVKNPDKELMEKVVKDLISITYKFRSFAIHAAVECLANICTYVMKNPGHILGLANTFYTVLRKFQAIKDFSKESTGSRSSAQRGLVVLGCITRYYNFKQIDPNIMVQLPKGNLPTELDASNIYVLSYRMISLYLQKDVETETTAIQAMCSLFTGCMPLMLSAQRDGLIGRMLCSAHKNVALETLRSLREVLLAEETRVESGQAREIMAKSGVTLKQQVKGDQDAEASIVGGVMQEHLESVKKLLYDTDVAVRGASLSLLGVLHRQGLVNPLQTIPCLIALQGDVSPAIRADAYRQLVLENEKHPEFLCSRVLDGVCQCYQLQSTCFDKVSALTEEREGGAQATTCCILGPLYSSCIRSNRKNRFSFLRSLLSLFEEDMARSVVQNSDKSKRSRLSLTSSSDALGAAGSKTQKGSLNPHFLAFVAQLLAYLPYDVQEEPLFIIYNVSRQVNLGVSGLLTELKELFSRARVRIGGDEGHGGAEKTGGGVNGKVEDDADSDGDAPTPLGKGPRPMDMDGDMEHHNIPPVVLAQLKDKCAAAMAFCALLRLKFFLKNVYNLSDDKCMEYKPQEVAKAAERAIVKPETFPDFSLPDNLLVSLEEGPELVPTLVLQFNEFRRLIRGDPADFKLHKVVKSNRGRKSSVGGGGSRAGAGTPGEGGKKRRESAGRGRGGRGGRGGGSAAKRRKVSQVEEYEGESSSEEEESSSSEEEED